MITGYNVSPFLKTGEVTDFIIFGHFVQLADNSIRTYITSNTYLTKIRLKRFQRSDATFSFPVYLHQLFPQKLDYFAPNVKLWDQFFSTIGLFWTIEKYLSTQ